MEGVALPEVVGQKIQITVQTSVIEKNASVSPKSIDLSCYPAGNYTVEYRSPDKTTLSLGKITLLAKKKKKNQ